MGRWPGIFLLTMLAMVPASARPFNPASITTAATEDQSNAVLDLSGSWRLRLDPEDRGLKERWPELALPGSDRIDLPGTTDLANWGFALDPRTMQFGSPFPVTTLFPGLKEPTRADERGTLVRRHLFVGPAWYEREIDVPESWAGRHLSLRLERAIWQTTVWVDGCEAGTCESLVSEHRHDLKTLAPGRHRLTVRVDNRMIRNITTITHAYGPETQSRWNGLIGRLTLEAAAPVSIASIQAYPAADRRSVRLVTTLVNAGKTPRTVTVKAHLSPERDDATLGESSHSIDLAPGTNRHELPLTLNQPAEPWDEFSTARYRAVVEVLGDDLVPQRRSDLFGFRAVETAGKVLRINGRTAFLRGELDCCVFPKTGHPPMDVESWLRMLSLVKGHGFNTVRFHTWCPPEAAFEAADRLGIYVQPETPAWIDDWGRETTTKPAGVGRDPEVLAFWRDELRRICESYGNHPSFLMLTIGNEFGIKGTDWIKVNDLIAEMKAFDPRRLYSGCTARRHGDADDFWVTHDSGTPTRGVGPPRTDWDFAPAVASSPVPLISHETGQRPVYPDFPALLPKFTGPLLPLNLERFRRSLRESGQEAQLGDFVRASARFQLVQYKAEHEAMLRTHGLSGYHLLQLLDFPGQSEALVGILDPFGESKGIVTPEDVREWNAPSVVLARFAKYTWTSSETIRARLEIAHFGAATIAFGRLTWELATASGTRVARGEFDVWDLPAGKVSDLGELSIRLAEAPAPSALVLRVQLGPARNHWNLWVYPDGPEEPAPPGVRVTATLDEAARKTLQDGGKVLWLAHGLRSRRAARSAFESVYWSAGWWGNPFSSLGILCDPAHPAFRAFPNQGWSDWQWHDLCTGGTTFRLDEAPPGLRPIVQLVPDFHFNSRLAQVFEARVGRGSLLVCGYNLADDLDRRHAARQFRRSLYRYVAGDEFRPSQEVPASWVESLMAR